MLSFFLCFRAITTTRFPSSAVLLPPTNTQQLFQLIVWVAMRICVLNDPKRKQKFNDFKCKVAWFLHLPLLVRSKGSSLQCRYYFSSSCWPIVIQKERWALFEWNFVTKGIQIQTEWKNAFTQWLLRLLVLRITPISLRILHVLHVRKLLPRQMI